MFHSKFPSFGSVVFFNEKDIQNQTFILPINKMHILVRIYKSSLAVSTVVQRIVK